MEGFHQPPQACDHVWPGFTRVLRAQDGHKVRWFQRVAEDVVFGLSKSGFHVFLHLAIIIAAFPSKMRDNEEVPGRSSQSPQLPFPKP